ncbi:MAG: SUMF1/EgtB/PvdO family nonheme iron enzyme [Planctomycetes bacterium]|nr:SUMF1/EgtB/PvdO family nonheme iron enzyme [Planctomycetota bacterium]
MAPALLALSTLAPGALAQAAAKPAATPAPAAGPDLTGLPTFLQPVPGGRVKMGMTADKLIEAACQTVNPARPANAAPEKVARALKNTCSELGSIEVPVETFLLGKWTVTNEEYEVFVKHMRANKIPVRVPYHWWRYGCKEDYEARLPAIAQQFPKDPMGALYYWEQNGTTLPYKLVDEYGKSIAKLPLTYINYREAMRFAGWLGMRLPTEAEWTRAARGDGSNVWLWGTNKDLGDRWQEKILNLLKLEGMRDKTLKPVGEVQFANGPYGHFDMVGQVWELTAELGFGPLAGTKSFADEWKKLAADKLGALVQNPPLWKAEVAIAKGGSYLSSGNPIELHIDARVAVQTIDVVQSLGVRLAKSMRPGYDALYSLSRGVYNTAVYETDQTVALTEQIGAEKYELGADGFPTNYHTVSFAPTNFLAPEKSAAGDKLLERSQQTPLVVGMLALTEKALNPDMPAGQYTVLYRQHGVPKELTDALKAGHKEVQAALKAKERSGGAEEPKKDDKPADDKKKDDDKQDKNKKGAWRDVIAKFGLTEADLEPKDALDKLNFIRLKGAVKDNLIVVPTDTNCFLFFDSEGRMAGLVPAGTNKPAVGNPLASALALTAHKHGDKDGTKVELQFSVPLNNQSDKRQMVFKLELTIDCAPPSATNPWRMSPAVPAAGAGAGNENRKGK